MLKRLVSGVVELEEMVWSCLRVLLPLMYLLGLLQRYRFVIYVKKRAFERDTKTHPLIPAYRWFA